MSGKGTSLGLTATELQRTALEAVWKHMHGINVDGKRRGASQAEYLQNHRAVMELVGQALGDPGIPRQEVRARAKLEKVPAEL